MKWKFWETEKQPNELTSGVQVKKSRKLETNILSNPPTNEELRTWATSQAGKHFQALLHESLEDQKDLIVSGYFLNSESADSTAQHISKAIGMAEQLTYTIEMLDEYGKQEEIEE